jgi:hypothetical protein
VVVGDRPRGAPAGARGPPPLLSKKWTPYSLAPASRASRSGSTRPRDTQTASTSSQSVLLPSRLTL